MGHSDRGALQTHDDERNMTTTELLEEIHPGEVLLKDFMQSMGITARQLAADIDVPPSRISGIVNARRPITADTAVRLGMFFRMDARFWVNLQVEYDVRIASRALQQWGGHRIRTHRPRTGVDAV
jgi:addiction module HigA family antidote